MIESKIKQTIPAACIFSAPSFARHVLTRTHTQPKDLYTAMLQFAGRVSFLLVAGILVGPGAVIGFTIRQPVKMAATATKAGASAADQQVEEPLLLRAARGEVRDPKGERVGWCCVQLRSLPRQNVWCPR